MQKYDILVVGGGAAGFFSAINLKEKNPNLSIAILERGKDVLQKVRVSGGGRCNLTHACFDPEQLSKFYPRGEAELRNPFIRFNPTHTIAWFEERGVKTKTETDGRMFPTSNSSESIINCFLSATKHLKIDILTHTRVEKIEPHQENWLIKSSQGEFVASKLVLATGSDTAIWNLLQNLQINIIPPVPSLFTFNIKDPRLDGLMGLSVPQATIKINKTAFSASGGLLITHWGLSGPAILRLSAWAARDLHDKQYRFQISVNWTTKSTKEVSETLHGLIQTQAKKNVQANTELCLPMRLWKVFCAEAQISEQQKWAEVGKKHILRLSEQITNTQFEVNGKSTFKEEFVTAGGIDLSEVDFERFSLKEYPTLFAAGEVLNIDAITGGFNFQAAWTGAWHISEAATKN